MNGKDAEELVKSGLRKSKAPKGLFLCDRQRAAISAFKDSPSFNKKSGKKGVVCFRFDAKSYDNFVHEFTPYDNFAASEHASYYEISTSNFNAVNAAIKEGKIEVEIINLVD